MPWENRGSGCDNPAQARVGVGEREWPGAGWEGRGLMVTSAGDCM